MTVPTGAARGRAGEIGLDGWYHTIELAPGVVTRGVYDLRPVVDRVLPASLAGKTALDVGTADGFWAFEMEKRGADRVVAMDIERMGDCDVLPIRRALLHHEFELFENDHARRFRAAHERLGSRVEYRTGSVYRLSPEAVGTFDVVYCGSLLVHLFNPLKALINIRSVTREAAIIEVGSFHPDYDPIEPAFPDRPYAWFGSLDAEEGEPGKHCMYWRFTQRALCDMLAYAGFAATEPRGHYRIKGVGGGDCEVATVVAHVQPGAAAPRAEPRHELPSYDQLRRELAGSRSEAAALRARLAAFEGLGPRSIVAARRLQRLSRRFPRVASALRKVASLM
jgi:tRNA (mo5U34)-methyltransferase